MPNFVETGGCVVTYIEKVPNFEASRPAAILPSKSSLQRFFDGPDMNLLFGLLLPNATLTTHTT